MNEVASPLCSVVNVEILLSNEVNFVEIDEPKSANLILEAEISTFEIFNLLFTSRTSCLLDCKFEISVSYPDSTVSNVEATVLTFVETNEEGRRFEVLIICCFKSKASLISTICPSKIPSWVNNELILVSFAVILVLNPASAFCKLTISSFIVVIDEL